MKVSVIIPTYNGAHKIRNVLHALALQTVQDFEIITVIDGSTDDTAAILQSMVNQFPRLQVIEQANGGRSKVRNRGAAEASGDILIFFDDDMRPNVHAVRQHIDHHLAFPGSILTGGQMEEIIPGMPDFERFKATLSRKWSHDFDDAHHSLTVDNLFLTAANFSIAKSTFETLGGFDERLTDAEDYDLAVRAFRQNIKVYADLSIVAWHDDKVTCSSYIRRLRQYRSAQEKLAGLKPELYGGRTKYYSPVPVGLKKVFFSCFCSRPLIKSIDNNVWSWLPENIKYKLYDWVITANGSFFPDRIKL